MRKTLIFLFVACMVLLGGCFRQLRPGESGWLVRSDGPGYYAGNYYAPVQKHKKRSHHKHKVVIQPTAPRVLQPPHQRPEPRDEPRHQKPVHNHPPAPRVPDGHGHQRY